MKSILRLLGTSKTDISSGTIAVNQGRAQWSNRLIQVEGPAPAELANYAHGSFPVEVWERLVAGQMTWEEAKAIDFPDSWRSAPVVTWLPVTNDGASYGKAFKALKHLVSRDSPRNYGTVVSCAGNQLCATDGFRLSYFELPTMNPMMFPAFGLSLASKLLKGSSSIQVTEDGSMIRICSGEWVAHFRAPNVKFPAYSNVIPQKMKPVDESAAREALALAELRAPIYPKDISKHGAGTFAELKTEHGTMFFNPKFFRELDGFTDWQCGGDVEEPIKARRGKQVYVLVPVKVPEELKAKRA